MPVHHRSALAKFRCGVAPISVETGRYERFLLESRLCVQCNSIEHECHVICECPLYQDLRNSLIEHAKPIIRNFEKLNAEEKICAALSNNAIVKYTAKILHEILVRKRSFIYTIIRIEKKICSTHTYGPPSALGAQCSSRDGYGTRRSSMRRSGTSSSAGQYM